MKIYIGNLPFSANEGELEELFSKSGQVSSCMIIKDRDTGRSKGFGFIEFDSSEAGSNAISEFDGYDMGGRKLRVSEARERQGGGRSGGGRPRR